MRNSKKQHNNTDTTIHTKICSECKRELLETNFNYWNKSLGTRMSICKECEKKRNAKKHEDRKELINTLKSCGCCCCDETDVNCLDFHHVEPSQKDFNMSSATNKTVRKILEEASKCIVVCSNCHRKIHAGVLDLHSHINEKQFNYMRSLLGLYTNLLPQEDENTQQLQNHIPERLKENSIQV